MSNMTDKLNLWCFNAENKNASLPSVTVVVVNVNVVAVVIVNVVVVVVLRQHSRVLPGGSRVGRAWPSGWCWQCPDRSVHGHCNTSLLE